MSANKRCACVCVWAYMGGSGLSKLTRSGQDERLFPIDMAGVGYHVRYFLRVEPRSRFPFESQSRAKASMIACSLA